MNLKLPLICILLLIKSLCMVRGGLPKTYGEIVDSLIYKEKLIFDISHTLAESSGERCKKVLGKAGGIRHSPVVYCGPDLVKLNENRDFWDGDDGFTSPAILQDSRAQTLALSLLHNEQTDSTHPLTAGTMKAYNVSIGVKPEGQITTIILNIQDLSPSLAKNLKIMLMWMQSSHPNTKIGIEFDDRSYNGNDLLLRIISDLLDVVIVDIHLPPETFLFSYSSFKRQLGGILEDKYGFIRKTLPHCTFYAKLDFQSDTKSYPTRATLTWTQEHYQKYYFYLLQFSVIWLNDNDSGDRKLILPTFNTTSESKMGFDGTPWRELVVADVSLLIYILRAWADCSVISVLEQVSLHLESIRLRSILLDEMSTGILNNWTRSACRKGGAKNIFFFENPQTSIMLLLSSTSLKFPSYPSQSVDNFEMDGIKIEMYIDSNSKSKIPELRSNLKIVCGHTHDYPTDPGKPLSLQNNIRKDYPTVYPIYQNDSRCASIWNQSAVIMWYIEFPADYYDIPYDFNMGLETVRIQLEEFLKRHLGKKVFLNAVFPISGPLTYQSFTYSLYCNPVNVRRFELVESFINFARINSIPVKALDILGDVRNDDGGWTLLETVDDLEERLFPFHVARNYPEKFLLGDFQTDPCILRTREVPQGGIGIDAELDGVVLYMTGMKSGTGNSGRLAQGELEMLLQFVFHKFSLAEVLPGDNSDLETLVKVLSNQNLIKKLANQKSQQPKLYIGLSYDHFNKSLNSPNLADLSAKLLNVALKPTGIHFQNWTNTTTSELDHLVSLRSRGMLIGICMDDCVDEVRNGFATLKNLFSNPGAPVDYVLCNIKHPAEATNLDIRQTGKYLDTTLYIRKYFQTVFPEESTKTEILFRLNVKPVTSGIMKIELGGREHSPFLNSTAEFLKFFSDVCQYSTAYKMKLFMLPAFDGISGTRMGWWRTSHFNGLTNSSNFVDIEDEFLGRETWRPIHEPEAPMNWSKFVIFGTSSAIILLVISMFLLRLWYRRQYPILAKDEVDYFLFGKSNDNDITFESRKFPDEFEIPKRRIILLNLIGQGNFGLVYKANLTTKGGTDSENISVAIKMPHPDSSRESFKSMLSELKVLAHIGSHQHVLEFVGAYTKEIGKGIVYIATELCEFGALLEHLRLLHTQLSIPAEESKLARQNLSLYRFAHEIALGMEFISSRNVVHGDLSTRNVLLDSNLVCKICDFGLSRKLYDYQTCLGQPEGSLQLPWRWLAIESLQALKFTTKSDVWSYGVTLWEIFSLGCVPYPEHKFDNAFIRRLENGFRLSSPAFSTEAIYLKMRQCWETNPEMRPSFTELAQFFRNNRDVGYVPVVIAWAV